MGNTAELGHNPSDDVKLNNHLTSLNDKVVDSADSNTTPRLEQPHGTLTSGNPDGKGPMKGKLMSYTQMLEAMDTISESIDDPVEEDTDEGDVLDQDIDEPAKGPEVNEQEILNELNKLFTPILISQGLEQDIAEHRNHELSESGVLTEKNMIAFDDETRMSQLIATCALLLAQKKNSPQWQMFAKASMIRKKSKLAIQEEEYDAAKVLAQKYLLMVSNTNNSSVARQAANDLLPQTQH